MYTSLKIYPYNLSSESAKFLATTLRGKRIRVDGSYRYKRGDLIVNWGNSHVPRWATAQALVHMLNKPQYVALASDKIQTFRILTEAGIDNIPLWTTNIETARGWFRRAVRPAGSINAVVCRTLTRANSGRGIVLAKSADEIVPAPLYTRYTPKQFEFRIHVSINGGIIDMQEKKKRNGFDGNKYIRSHDNGWVFCRENIQVPQQVQTTALDAVAAIGLDFAAVDIGYHEEIGAIIYELNTAPGIEGQTLENYGNHFRSYFV